MFRPFFQLPFSSALLSGCLLAASIGCGEAETSSEVSGPAGADAPGKPRIALVMKSLANEFFSTMAQGAKEYQQANSDKFELVVNGIRDETDLSGQVSLVEQMIAQQVDAIVIAPADSRALVPVLQQALDAGITVINIDNKLDDAVLQSSGIHIPFVGPDNQAGAAKVAGHLASVLKPGDKVVVLEGIQTSFNGQQRKLGFEAAMKQANIEIVASQSAKWEMSIANQTAAGLLTAHPDLQGILACNDSMALGALAAVKEAGRLGNVQIVGFDNITAVRQAIMDGEILATADQHGDQLAVFGIDDALRALAEGGELSDRETPVDLITAESLREPSAAAADD
ncbi:MAG: sugar ABC transporter substrate-binding protein [Fuerstiella sp.]